MDTILETEIYRKAVKKWGIEAQLKLVAEECAELIQAVLKYGRKINGTTVKEITEEMADLEIMLEQLKFIFNNENEVAFEIGRKLARLKELVEK